MNDIISLAEMYEHVCQKGPTFRQHVAAVKKIAKQCSSVVELGVCEFNTGFGILLGLSESSSLSRSYLGIDKHATDENILNQAKKWAQENRITFSIKQENDLDMTALEPVDFLHIDTSHTYMQLTYELETFAPFVRSYILMHDTSYPYGYEDSLPKEPDHKFPKHINRLKRGLALAVDDFLQEHPEWFLFERDLEPNGYSILKRADQ